MKINKGKAECWRYRADKKDKENIGIYYGWHESPAKSYRHHPCDGYFTVKGEKHICKRIETKEQLENIKQTISLTYTDACARLYKTIDKEKIGEMAITDACKIILASLGFKEQVG